MKKNIPAVSIIIPMYNAEKYIDECLDSILAQTFTDFEVIVVDDCSTDKSCSVVESYLSKFDDKLKLIRRKKNSGNPGPPSNDGIKNSSGEYILFLDNDDAIIESALEELYTLAKKFNADVVHCKRYYRFPADKKYSDESARFLHAYLIGGEELPPEFLTNDIAKRVTMLNQGKVFLNLWTKLIKRDLIIKNKLRLINGMAQDMVFTCCVFLSAEKYLFVPNSVNLYRVVPESLSHARKSVEVHLHQWLMGLTAGFDYFENFLNGREFFRKNLNVKFTMLEIWVRECCKYLTNIYAQMPAWQIDAFLRREFEHVENKTAFMAFLFSRMSIFNFNLNQQAKLIQQLNEKISAR